MVAMVKPTMEYDYMVHIYIYITMVKPTIWNMGTLW